VLNQVLPSLPAVLAGLLLASAAPAAEAKSKEDKPPEATSYKVKAVKDVVYHDGPDADKNKHKLDLYLPEGLKEFPVMVFVHGGAWMFGDRNFFGIYSGLANAYARQGIGVVVPSYRLSPGVSHPEHIKDVARAFAWTHKNIAKYGGRVDQIFISGHSAGGHLVALLTTDEHYLKDQGLSRKAIRGVIPISGVYRVPERFLPRVFGTADEAGKKASPLTYVEKDLPPFLILYADGDLPGCDRKPSEMFCAALKRNAVQAETLEIRGSNHYNILFDAGKAGTKVSAAIVAFIRLHAGK
jgi:acetyl esterase/lipase